MLIKSYCLRESHKKKKCINIWFEHEIETKKNFASFMLDVDIMLVLSTADNFIFFNISQEYQENIMVLHHFEIYT